MPLRPRQPAEKQRVVAVAAGGVDVQPARLQQVGQQVLGQLHRRQVGQAVAAENLAPAHKAEPAGQRPGGPVGRVGQRGGKAGFGRGVKPAAGPQHLLEQVAAVAPAAPLGQDLQLLQLPAGYLRPADDRLLLVQQVLLPANAGLTLDAHRNAPPFGHYCTAWGGALSTGAERQVFTVISRG